MDHYEYNYIVLRTILSSCLSNINKSIALWYCGIILSEEEEEEEDCNLSSTLNLKIDKLKQIIESYGINTINDYNINVVIDTSDHGGNYTRSIFCFENSLLVNYFAIIFVTTVNKYQRNMYYIGLGYTRETKINPSSQFNYKNHVSIRN